MKTSFYTLLSAISVSALTLSACGSETDTTTDQASGNSTDAPVYEYITSSTWNFAPESSSITWHRELDQKPTKKKVKLFGAMVDLEMGAVQMEMDGDVQLKSGFLNDENGEYQNGAVNFDMATFKFAQEQGEGLFNTKEFPESTLEFLSFTASEDTVANYTSQVKLTIQDHSEEFEVPVNMTDSGDGVNMQGVFSFNTLDFPLRDDAKKKDVNKDEITVNMDMNFVLGTMVKDSVQVK